jgi:uncharacterized protein (DUF488 family)
VLRHGGVTRLVDVRRYPASRRNPQFGRAALEGSLPAAGIEYEFGGDAFGGRRHGLPPDESRHPAWRDSSFRAYADYMDTDAFRARFRELLERARTTPTAVMCAETVWWRCHRRLLADAAVLRDVEVLHLGIGDAPRPHVLHPAVRADDDGWPVYDVGTQLEL